MAVDTLRVCLPVRIVHGRRQHAERVVRTAFGGFEQQPRHTIVVTGLLPADIGAARQFAMEYDVVFSGGHQTVAKPTRLARHLRGADQIHRLEQIAIVDDRVEALVRRTRRAADPSRVHHRVRRTGVAHVAGARFGA